MLKLSYSAPKTSDDACTDCVTRASAADARDGRASDADERSSPSSRPA